MELVVLEEAEVGADLEVYPEAKVKTVIAAQLELEVGIELACQDSCPNLQKISKMQRKMSL